MQSKRWSAWILIIMLFAVLAVAGYFAIFSEEKIEKKKISVLINESMDERWVIVKEGMEQAASDYEAELNVVLTDRIKELGEQEELILREIGGGANGIVIDPVSSVGLSNVITEYQGTVAITLMGSDVLPENVYDCVAPDCYEMGIKLGEALKADYEDNPGELKIGVLASASPNYAAEQCMKGFLKIIDGTSIVWRMDPDSRMDSEIVSAIKLNDVNVLVCFESRMTESAVDVIASDEFENSPVIYGTGYSQKAIYNLDKGTVKKLVLTNEFNLGYLAVKSAATKQTPQGISYPPMEIFVVDRNDLYDEALQKVLFPLVQ